MQDRSGYRLVQLANSAVSIRSLEHQETFHPVIGPVAEAEALYVRQLRLEERLVRHRGVFVIWDVGLGAAANPLTVLSALRHRPGTVEIISFDQSTEPLRFALEHRDQLPFLAGYESSLRSLIETQKIQFADGRLDVIWQLRLGDFPSLISRQLSAQSSQLSESNGGDWTSPHAILFDAYSPAKNPAMWTHSLFGSIARILDPRQPCAMATYSRSTMLRVSLLLAGFYVGAGHATGEKEETTIAANALELIEEPLNRKWLRRARNSTSAEPLWEPIYRQAPMTTETWERLQHHPQFQ